MVRNHEGEQSVYKWLFEFFVALHEEFQKPIGDPFLDLLLGVASEKLGETLLSSEETDYPLRYLGVPTQGAVEMLQEVEGEVLIFLADDHGEVH
jgi:hypothetical protein